MGTEEMVWYSWLLGVGQGVSWGKYRFVSNLRDWLEIQECEFAKVPVATARLLANIQATWGQEQRQAVPDPDDGQSETATLVGFQVLCSPQLSGMLRRRRGEPASSPSVPFLLSLL